MRIVFLFIVMCLFTACSGSAGPEPEDESENPTVLPFTETFDDADSCFNLASGDASDLGIENGELFLNLTESFIIEWSTCEDIPLSDFTLKMDVFDDSSTDDFRFFGLQLRKGPVNGTGFGNYVVRLGLGGEGPPVYCLGLVIDNKWQDDLTKSPSGDSCWVELAQPIQAGEWIQFEVTLDGSEISLAVNGASVASVSDESLNQGVFTLLGGTHEAEAARFKFDNVRITAPGE